MYLTDLELTGLGVIDTMTLRLGPGLNVLTGETGAGKTMVVTALQWLLGARADRDRVRTGMDSAIVQANFSEVPDSAREFLDPADETLLVTREIVARHKDGWAGRSTARLGGRMATVSALVEVLRPVLEIHAQDESVRLGDPVVQRVLLDRYGKDDTASALQQYREAFDRWRTAASALETLRASSRQHARIADHLRAEAEEITSVNPVEGEEDELDAVIAKLQNVEDLKSAAADAATSVVDDGGARDLIGTAIGALDRAAENDSELAVLADRLRIVASEVQDIGVELSGYGDGLDADPEQLEAAVQRRTEIGRLLRKYGPTTHDVLAHLESIQAQLLDVDGGEERVAQLEADVVTYRCKVEEQGDELRKLRTDAARRLAEAIDGHLADLAMPDAKSTITVTPCEPGPNGADTVEFLLSANPGQPALSIANSASGGERSRIALAVKVALADADDTPVMVFDEVDAGIGGDTALAVGRKLHQLAQGRQVLCVTHLAQLAAFADVHVVVTKTNEDNSTRTQLTHLAPEERSEELSRMLSGSTGEAGIAHANELLELARRQRVTVVTQ